MTTKPSQSESEFFAREEAEKIHRLSEQQRRERSLAEREQSRQIHFMKCPKCGADLRTIRLGLVDVEECTQCEALVLDKGELQKIKVADNTLLKSFLDVFRKED